MSATGTIIHLTPENFSEKEITLVENSPLSASTFRFDSGVSGIRLRNELGSLVLLPFQGQQIWSAEFHGRNLTMKSMFSQPRPTRQYLDTYGGFLLHCGATAMGVPTKDDSHPLHGELPNAPFQHAYLAVGEDERGLYLGLGANTSTPWPSITTILPNHWSKSTLDAPCSGWALGSPISSLLKWNSCTWPT
jgi:hypothetical protein